MTTLRALSTAGLALLGLHLAPIARAGDAPPKSPPPGIDASPALKLARSGSTPVGAEGFLDRWLVLDPVPGDGLVTESAVRAAAQKDYFPDQLSVVPRAGDQVVIGDQTYAWRAVESKRHNLNLYHFAFFQGKPTSNVVFWGVTIVESPEDIPNVRLAVGSNSGSVWWVNGQESVALYGDIQTFIDDTASRKFTLRKGRNVVRFLVVNNRGMTDCCARFLDANDQPLTRLTLVLPGK